LLAKAVHHKIMISWHILLFGRTWRPTRHEIGHFRDTLPSQSLASTDRKSEKPGDAKYKT